MEARQGRLARRVFHYLLLTFKLAGFVALIAAAVLAVNQTELSRYFPIKNVNVYGVNHADQEEIQSLLTPLVTGSFFNVKVEYIRDRLLQMPWVADTYVRRYWPDKVEITVIEKNAVARWNDESLLSQNGDLFSPASDTYPNALPQFTGPEGTQDLMMRYFAEMNHMAALIHARIAYLELTPYAVWNATLDNGISLRMGYQDVLSRFGHFVEVYPKIVGNRETDVEYIDLRYPNGVAVRWKAPTKT